MNKQSGFTLIELCLVITIIAILAVTMLPKYVDLRNTALQNTLIKITGDLTELSGLNQLARITDPSLGVKIRHCKDAADLLVGSAMPSGYTIVQASIPVGYAVNCTVKGPTGLTRTFVGLGIN